LPSYNVEYSHHNHGPERHHSGHLYLVVLEVSFTYICYE